MGELQPIFHIQVLLDGDDDVKMQTNNVMYVLELALIELKNQRLIRDGNITIENVNVNIQKLQAQVNDTITRFYQTTS